MTNLFRRRPEIFYRQGDDVVIYPVAADRVAAYLSAGGVGVILRGTFTEDDVLAETDAGVEVQTPELIFETTQARADAAGIEKDRSAVEFDGKVYSVFRRTLSDPGFVRFWLRSEGY